LGVHAVAITRLNGALETEAKALATDLGAIPYETRLKLAGGIPAIVLHTPDPARAAAIVAKLRARGHDAFAVDTAEVVAATDMVIPSGCGWTATRSCRRTVRALGSRGRTSPRSSAPCIASIP
jgi:hypothetical protein